MAEPRSASTAAVAPSMSIAQATAALGIFLPLAGLTAALTVLFLGVRAVMDIGGACEHGGPLVPAQPCARGGAGLMAGAISAGLVLVAVYVWQCARHRVPSFAAFAWPALFLSLGWNFLEYGLDPPGGGIAWSWLLWAAVFAAMGGVPLALLIGAVRDVWTRRPPQQIQVLGTESPSTRSPAAPMPPEGDRRGPETAEGPATPDANELVTSLERLDALHRTGALDDAEYEAAKRRLLGIEGGA